MVASWTATADCNDSWSEGCVDGDDCEGDSINVTRSRSESPFTRSPIVSVVQLEILLISNLQPMTVSMYMIPDMLVKQRSLKPLDSPVTLSVQTSGREAPSGRTTCGTKRCRSPWMLLQAQKIPWENFQLGPYELAHSVGPYINVWSGFFIDTCKNLTKLVSSSNRFGDMNKIENRSACSRVLPMMNT